MALSWLPCETQINDYLRNQKAMEIGAQYVAKLKAAISG